jgi:hypothetical protein
MDGGEEKESDAEKEEFESVMTCRVKCIESFQLNAMHPERHVLVMHDLNGTPLAMFGYYDVLQMWHFMIVPPEFREARVLERLQADLFARHGAILRYVPGDTINWSPEKKREYMDKHIPPRAQSPQ